MSLDIHHMANQADQHRFDRRVVRDHESLPRTERHPLVIRFGAAVSRFGHQLQGVPDAAGPEFQPCPELAAG